jgi:hypothetical protein
MGGKIAGMLPEASPVLSLGYFYISTFSTDLSPPMLAGKITRFC